MPSSQSNQSVLDALKIGRAYQNLPAVNKCDAIPPQALHRMKVDDIAAVTLFKILCRQEFFHLRKCERIALRFIVCINDAAVVACLHIQYFCEEVSVLLGNTALQHDAPGAL